MTNIYACLTGNWVCLNDDHSCTVGSNGQSPSEWFNAGAGVYAPFDRESENTYYQLEYVNIFYRGKNYRISPIFIQIVTG